MSGAESMSPAEMAQALKLRLDAAKRDQRIANNREWPKLIHNRSYRVNGTDCVIWIGPYSKTNGRSCWFAGSRGTRVDVKTFVTGTPVVRGEIPVWGSTCGNGRCINPDHVTLIGRRVNASEDE